ncbi:MAG: lipopolysaccharide transport periplasmic protein LptA [Thiotrichales bacterium]
MHRKFKRILTAALVVLSTQLAAAPDPKQPVNISADTLTLDQKTQSTTYAGNVVLVQGDMTLNADELTVYTRDAKLDRIEMKGSPARLNATLENGEPVSGQADQITFFSKTGLLVLQGNAAINQLGNTINSARIEYNLNSGNLAAGGEKAKSRVEVTFQPE